MSQPEGILAVVNHHNEFFNRLVNAIPAEFFILADASKAADAPALHKYAHNKKDKAPMQERKEAARAAKRAKLDPAQNLPVSERQAAMHAEQQQQRQDEPHNAHSVRHMESLTREQLKARLAEKLAQLRGRRPADGAPATEGNPRKRKHRDTDAEGDDAAAGDDSGDGGDDDADNDSAAEATAAPAAKKSKHKKEATVGRPRPGALGRAGHPAGALAGGAAGSSAAVTGADGPIFSKFDFSTTPRGNAQKKSGPTPAQLLQKIQRDKERDDKLKAEDPEKAAAVAEKEKWVKAAKRAEGEKVKDNPALIQKTIKRIKKVKEKSKKTWSDRAETVKTALKEKEDKRAANLKARKDANLERKLNRGKKKKPDQKKRPGFEGGKSKSPKK